MKRKPTNEQFQKQLDQMVQTLRDEIEQGVYRPGQYLPSEHHLSKRFGMSNNSVRKGLDILVREGRIEKIPRVGNKVCIQRAPVTLTLACNESDWLNLELENLLNDFHRCYPWITINAKPINFYMLGKNTELIESFDLFMITNTHPLDLPWLLHPLEINPDIYPFLTNQFIRDGRLYAQPIIFSPVVLCYNKQHFRESGIPEPDGSWTWNDLMQNAAKLTNGKGRYGFCFYLQNLNRWPIFLLQSGEKFEWIEGRLAEFRGSKLFSGIRLCKEIIHNRDVFPLYLSENNQEINRMFMEGKISMTLNTYLGLNEWKHADLEYDISPIPFIDQPITLAMVQGIGINRKTPHLEEAKQLVHYMTSEQCQNFIRKNTLSLPTLQSLHSTSVERNVTLPSRYSLYREMMFSYKMHSDMNIPRKDFSKLFTHLKAYWANLIDEEETCRQIYKDLSN